MNDTHHVLTADTHDECGSPIYTVASDRRRFCVSCSTEVA